MSSISFYCCLLSFVVKYSGISKDCLCNKFLKNNASYSCHMWIHFCTKTEFCLVHSVMSKSEFLSTQPVFVESYYCITVITYTYIKFKNKIITTNQKNLRKMVEAKRMIDSIYMCRREKTLRFISIHSLDNLQNGPFISIWNMP